MAAARDQAARILRPEPDAAQGGFARETSAALDEPHPSPVLQDPITRRPIETPAGPSVDRPAAAPGAAAKPAAPKSGKRKLVLMGVGALLALTAAGYGVHWLLVGRFYISIRKITSPARTTALSPGRISAMCPDTRAPSVVLLART